MVLAQAVPAPAVAAPGDLDAGFGTAGLAQIDLGGTESVSAAALDSADRIVVVGSKDGDGFVARIDTTGALDTTFGTDYGSDGTLDGYTLLDQGGNEFLESVVIDSQGRVYVGGQTDANSVGTYISFAARFLEDGTLDTSYAPSGAGFPGGGGTNICDEVDAAALALDASDNLHVFGTVAYIGQLAEPGLTVLDSAGNIVGSRCHLLNLVSTGATIAKDIVLEPSSGLPLFAGDWENDGFVARGLALGTALDTSYAASGIAVISRLVVANVTAAVDVNAIAVNDNPASAQYDFPVLVGNTLGKMLVVRLDGAGAYDTTFNGKGWRKIDFGTTAWGRDVTLDANGRILVAGKSNNSEVLLARVRKNGNLDGAFGTGGKVTTAVPLGGFSFDVDEVLVASTGRILVVGSGTFPGDIVVAGYLGN
jgi:uncharacterized delta-60 repeat protein